MIEVSPAAGIKPPAKEISRERVLEDGEITAVWTACGSLGFPFGPLIRMMLITAQREGECAGMRWCDVNLDGRIWVLPREQTKADRAHSVPLSELALETLAAVPRLHDGTHAMIFSTTGTTKPSGWGRAKERLDRLSGVTGWRLHDLRRTAASTMARLGHPPHFVAAVLNHAPGATQGVTRSTTASGMTMRRGRRLTPGRGTFDGWRPAPRPTSSSCRGGPAHDRAA